MVVSKTLVSSTGIFWVIALLFAGCTTSGDLEWHREEGYRWAELSPGFFGSTGFQELDSTDTGIRFRNFVSRERIEENRNFLNGSGVATADVDGDGWVDIYLAGLEGPNKLYRNRGNLEFEDITEEANLPHEGYYSTGVVFADVNGDSHPDLLVTSLIQRNELYINDGEGHFTLKEKSGLGPSKGSNTMTLADIDNDGDADFVINRFNQEALVYRNKTNPSRIAVQLSGEAPNTGGIGAKVTLKGASVDQQKEMSAGGSYVSGSQPMLFFAAGSGDQHHVLTVQWPGGSTTRIDSVRANRVYDIEEKSSSRASVKSPPKKKRNGVRSYIIRRGIG